MGQQGWSAASTAVTDDSVTALCPECGDVVEIHDIRALLLALHMVNECSVRTLLSGAGHEE